MLGFSFCGSQWKKSLPHRHLPRAIRGPGPWQRQDLICPDMHWQWFHEAHERNTRAFVLVVWRGVERPRCSWARGKGKVSPNPNKVQHCFLLNTQNGCSYGPVSIQAEQFFVPTTNFAFFHAGQPKVIHDYWGQAFVKDCPFGGMGWEFRPTFLWPRSQPDDDESAPHVSFEGANRFIMDLLANLALKYGQTLDSKNFASTPLLLSQAALPLWNTFRHCAETSKDDVPEFAAGLFLTSMPSSKWLFQSQMLWWWHWRQPQP